MPKKSKQQKQKPAAEPHAAETYATEPSVQDQMESAIVASVNAVDSTGALDKVASLETQMTQLVTEKETINAELEATKQKLLETQHAVESAGDIWVTKCEETQALVAQLEAQVVQLTTDNSEMASKVQEVSQRLENASDPKASSQTGLNSSSADESGPVAEKVEKLEAQVEKLEADMAKKDSEVELSKKKFMAAVKKLKREEEKTKEVVAALEEDKRRLQLQVDQTDGVMSASYPDADLAKLTEAMTKLAKEKEDAGGKIEALQSQLEAALGQMAEEKTSGEQLRREKSEFEVRLASALAGAEDGGAEMEALVAQMRAQREQAEGEGSAARQALDEMRTHHTGEKTELEGLVTALRCQLDAATSGDSNGAANGDVSGDASALTAEVAALKAELDTKQRKFMAAAKRKTLEFKEDLAKVTVEKESVEKEKEKVVAQLGMLRGALPELEAEVDRISQQEQKAQDQTTEAKAALTRAEEAKRAAQFDAKTAAAQVQKLQDTIEELRAEKEGLGDDFGTGRGGAGGSASLDKELKAAKRKIEEEEEKVRMFKEQLEEVADSSSLSRATNGKLEVRVAELTTTKAKLLEEIESVKKKFMMVAKKKQMEYMAKLKAKGDECESALEQLEKLKVQCEQTAGDKAALEATSAHSGKSLDAAEERAKAAEAELEAIAKESTELQASSLEEHRAMEEELGAELEEVRTELEAKERALKEARKLASNQEQELLEREFKAAEKAAELAGQVEMLKRKLEAQAEEYTMQIVELERQCTQAMGARAQAEQVLSAREKQLEQVESSTSSDSAKLCAQVEVLKTEAVRRQREQEAEREKVKAALMELKRKAERAERGRKKTEMQAAESTQVVSTERDAAQAMAAEMATTIVKLTQTTERLQSELKDYKMRAHALLKRRDDELTSAKDLSVRAELEERLRESEKAAARANKEAAMAVEALEAERERWVEEVEQWERRGQDMEAVHVEVLARFEKEAAQARQRAELAEASAREWEARVKDKAGEKEKELAKVRGERGSEVVTLEEQLVRLTKQHHQLQTEFNGFREIASTMVEAKDREIGKILEDTAELRMASHSAAAAAEKAAGQLKRREGSRKSSRELGMVPFEGSDGEMFSDLGNGLGNGMGSGLGAGTLVVYEGGEGDAEAWEAAARLQSQRDAVLAETEAHAEALEAELTEMQTEGDLRREQEKLLKEEVHDLQRQLQRYEIAKKGGVDMEYLKNIILKLLQTGEHEVLLPVLAMILKFSPNEVQKCRDTYAQMFGTPMPEAAGVVDTALTSAPKVFDGGLSLLDQVSKSFGYA